MNQITIESKNYNQKIIIGHNLNKEILNFFKKVKYDKILIITDKNILKKFQIDLQNLNNKINATAVIKIKTNTKKDFIQLFQIIKKIQKYALNRKSALLVIAGGHLGDLSGFASSIYMRGIDMIYVPTTPMSQMDSIIGKVAVNFKKEKNLLGAFYTPKITFCDSKFIENINQTKMAQGLVEAWKHSILTNDQTLEGDIKNLIKKYDNKKAIKIIFKSLKIKKLFVKNDPKDTLGTHKALSLGHTTANFLEKNNKIEHGEAVLYGIVFATLLSQNLKFINKQKLNKIMDVAIIFLNIFKKNNVVIKQLKKDEMLKDILKDKINHNNKYNYVIPTSEGWQIAKNIDKRILEKTANEMIILLKKY